MMTKSNNKNKKENTPTPTKKAKPETIVSLDVDQQGQEPAVFSAETTRDLLQDAREARYEKEVARHTDDAQIEDALAQRQQLAPTESPLEERRAKHNAKSPAVTAGDVDAAWEQANAAGEETVGGTAATPGQNSVEALGKAAGITYDDDEPLQTAAKIAQRDEDRWELDIDSKA